MAAPSNMEDRITEYARKCLRREQPWMKSEAVAEAAQRAGALARSEVDQQHEQIEQSKAKISFLSLSAELRNSIYVLALVKPRKNGSREITEIDIGTERRPALTQTCRQVRDECLPVYLGLNRFSVGFDQFLDSLTIEWLALLGQKSALMLKHFTIYRRISDCDFEDCQVQAPELMEHMEDIMAANGVRIASDALRVLPITLEDSESDDD